MPHQSRQNGLLRLKHLREQTEAKEYELEAQRARFVRLARADSKPRVISAFNLFQTPADLADLIVQRAIELVGKPADEIVWLEPSAGLGRIYHAIRRQSAIAKIVMVEQSAECCGELYRLIENDENARMIQADFLTCDKERIGAVDVAAMNPPFKMGRDVKHCLHAREVCKSGIVSLCFDGSRQNKKLEPIADSWEQLPEDTFKTEGTRARACLLTIEN